ncbi:hypothetical protein AXX16_3988 [Serratia rubidaea]|nr:hypothetical protein AXX16_3988 [Serratia rubidaea]
MGSRQALANPLTDHGFYIFSCKKMFQLKLPIGVSLPDAMLSVRR